MKQFIFGALVILTLLTVTMVAQGLQNNTNITISGQDPCQSNGIAKNSVAVNISTATTTQLVAPAAGQQIYVCGWDISVGNASATTSATGQLEYGTGSSCGTGTTALTGTVGDGAVGSAAVQAFPWQMTSGATVLKPLPVANALCLVSAGTSVNIQGSLNYVQQ